MVASTKWKVSHVFAQLQAAVRGLKKQQGTYKCNQVLKIGQYQKGNFQTLHNLAVQVNILSF
jgi:hypothetical protein